MARRWYIAPVSPPVPNTLNDGYHSSLADASFAKSYSAVIPTFTSGPNLGKPLYSFCLGQVATIAMALVMQLPNVLVFPDYPLDARLDGMDPETRAALRQSIEAYVLDDTGKRFDASVAIDDAASYRALIDSLGEQLQSGWRSADQQEPPEPTQ